MNPQLSITLFPSALIIIRRIRIIHFIYNVLLQILKDTLQEWQRHKARDERIESRVKGEHASNIGEIKNIKLSFKSHFKKGTVR